MGSVEALTDFGVVIYGCDNRCRSSCIAEAVCGRMCVEMICGRAGISNDLLEAQSLLLTRSLGWRSRVGCSGEGRSRGRISIPLQRRRAHGQGGLSVRGDQTYGRIQRLTIRTFFNSSIPKVLNIL